MTVSGERLLRAVSQTPWAIMPEKLEAILDVLEFRVAGVELAAEDVQGQFGRRGRRDSEAKGGVAVLPLLGIISQRMNMVTSISGGTSTEKFGARFDQLMANQDIDAIVIDVDSPGGNVEGVEELSRKIFEARESGEKRIVAVVNSLMASAAYWIGSAADEVVITPSGQAGSIGVFAVHTEFSEMEREAGIRRTLIKAGDFKAEANDFQPLSEEAEGHLQENVDSYFELFVEAVARNRGVEEASVRSGLGRGRVLTARQAVDAGLADRISTLEEVLEELGVEASRTAAARAEEDLEPAAVTGTTHDRARKVSAAPAPDAEQTASASTGSDTMKDHNDETTDSGTDGAAPDATATETPETDAAPEAAEEAQMSRETDAAPSGAKTGGGGVTATVDRDPQASERQRAQQITQLCSLHGLEDKAVEFIGSGKPVNQIVGEIFELKGNGDEPVTPEPEKRVDMTPAEEDRYSVARLIKAEAEGDRQSAGLEYEVHREIAKQVNREAKGIFVPTHLGIGSVDKGHAQELFKRGLITRKQYQSALEVETAAAGGDLVFEEPGSFIDMLRTRMVTTRMGATFMPGLVGNVPMPRQTGAGTFEWVAETPGSDISDSDSTYDQVVLSPNTGMSSTAFSRQLLNQSRLNVEGLVRSDLNAIAARGIDLAALHGGGGDAPTGIYDATGVNSEPAGGAIGWDFVVALETAVAADDADIGAMGYVTTPEVRGAAKTTEKATGTAQFIWTGGVRDGEMNGFMSMASNQVAKDMGTGGDEHGIIFGVWDQLLIGEWGALEIIVDPYSVKKQGLIEVTLFVMADVQLRHPEAFAKGTGLTVA